MNTSAPLVYHSPSYDPNLSDEDVITTIYVLVDTMLINLGKSRIRKLVGGGAGRKSSLTESELITLAVFRFHLGFLDLKHTYCFYKQYLRRLFPSLPNYQNFVAGTNRVSALAMTCLLILMRVVRKNTNPAYIKIIDSLPLPICIRKRAKSNKVCRGFATLAKSSIGYYFGMKLHAVVDTLGNLLNVRITTAKVDDRIPVTPLIKDLFGKFIADAGYLSEELTRELKRQGKVILTGVRKNMKKLMTKDNHQDLKKRQGIESDFSVLTARLGIRTSLPRSINGMFSHYTHTLLAYQIFKLSIW